jgi:hypothetical protein
LGHAAAARHGHLRWDRHWGATAASASASELRVCIDKLADLRAEVDVWDHGFRLELLVCDGGSVVGLQPLLFIWGNNQKQLWVRIRLNAKKKRSEICEQA